MWLVWQAILVASVWVIWFGGDFAMMICGVFSLVVVLIGFSGLILWFW